MDIAIFVIMEIEIYVAHSEQLRKMIFVVCSGEYIKQRRALNRYAIYCDLHGLLFDRCS